MMSEIVSESMGLKRAASYVMTFFAISALLMAAIGYLCSGWLTTALETGFLSFLLVIWFFISFVGPELKLPDATMRLSAFYYYGTPLVHGLPLWDMLGVLAVAIVALVLASVRFVSKDIAH